MNVAWGVCWGESRCTKPCVFPCKVAAAGDERYVCGGCGCGRFKVELVPPLCSATSGCSCLRDSMRLLILWLHDCSVIGCMIVVVFCCHVRTREMRVGHVMLQNAL